MKGLITIPLIVMLLITSCVCKKESQEEKPQEMTGNYALPQLVIYKTKADYNDKVPVGLSEDQTKVVSFPDPSDLKKGGELATPVQLNGGFLLDRRGIGPNVAFTSYTYAEYAALESVPAPDVIYSKVIDKDPLTELYLCGNPTDLESDIKRLNEVIDSGDLSSFTRKK